MKEHEHPYWKETLARAKSREDAGYELPGHYDKMKEHVKKEAAKTLEQHFNERLQFDRD